MGRRCACAIVALVLLAGCVGRGGGDKSAAPRRGGVLRLGITTLGSLDPGQARSVEEQLVADQLFDSLTAYDATTTEPLPALAERWTSSADQREWDFFLRPNAKFSNGREITAADVEWSYDRVARRGSGMAGTELLELVAGYRAFARDGTAPELAGVTAPEPRRLHVSLEQPLAVLPSVLASPVLGIVPREAVEAPEPRFGEAPVGSGPFRFARREGRRISLLSVRDSVLVDGIELVQFADITDAYESFSRGLLDWARVPPDRVEDAAVRFGKSGFAPFVGELLYGFNMRNPKFADSRVREALLLAIDRPSLARAVYGSTVQPLDGVIVRGIGAHQPDPCAGRCRHDVGRAKELLAEALPGAPPLEVAVDFDDDPTQRAVARGIQANLADAGVRVTLRPKPLEEYQTFALTGQQEMFRLGWIAAYPSPDAILPPLFLTGSPSNLTGYSVPAVDHQLREARATSDQDKRLGLYRAAERAVMTSLPVIPIAQLELHTVVAPRVRDLVSTATGTFDAGTVWLAATG